MNNLIIWLKYNRWLTALLVRLLKRRMLLGNANDTILYAQMDEWQSYEAPNQCRLYSDAPHVKAALEGQ